MAGTTVYISEYISAGRLDDTIPVGLEPSTDQTVAIAGSSTQSVAFKTNTRMIRIHVDGICSIAFGTNPTATTTNKRFAANQTEYFAVPPNSSYKLAVITNT